MPEPQNDLSKPVESTGSLSVDRSVSIGRAAEAVRQAAAAASAPAEPVVEPPDPAPAPEPPAATPPDPAPVQADSGAPGIPDPVPVPQTPQVPQPAEQPPEPEPAPAVLPHEEPAALQAPDRSWEALHNAEKKLAEERKALKADVQAQAAQPQGIDPQQLAADPIAVLRQHGWDEERLAGKLVEWHKAGKPAPAPAAPAEQPKQPPVSPSDTAAVEQRLLQVESFLIRQTWENAALRDPELELIAKTPGGIDFALERAAQRMEATGEALTPQEALAIAQNELIAKEKERISKLQGDAQWSRVLGLSGSPASPASSSSPAAEPPASAPEPQVTSISNTTAAAPPQPPVEAHKLSEEDRTKRAADAIRRAMKR